LEPLREGVAAFKAVEEYIPDPAFAGDRKYYEQIVRTESTSASRAMTEADEAGT
jgi:hypothetical protein